MDEQDNSLIVDDQALDMPVLLDEDSNGNCEGIDGTNEKFENAELVSFRSKWREELEDPSKNLSKQIEGEAAISNVKKSRRRRKNKNTEKLSTVLEDENTQTVSPLEKKDAAPNESPEHKIDKSNFVPEKDSGLKEEEKEELALSLFSLGVECERSGKLYEAIKHYKKALHLDPEVESKATIDKFSAANDQQVDEGSELVPTTLIDEEGLFSKLTNLMDPACAICQPSNPVTRKNSHISHLPREILENILLWLVGSELDTRSLHAVSSVCRGFYVISKSENIWKKACQRVWGRNCSLKPIASEYLISQECSSWREMFNCRPQPRYNGCYVSKTSYFRSGECNFLDSTYQPWYVVSYYRLFRFFPGGTVLMLTTADSPQNVVTHLAHREPRHIKVLSGTYKLEGSLLYLELTRYSNEDRHKSTRKVRRREQSTTDVEKTTLDITFELSSSRRGIRNWFLNWRHYTITSHLFTGYSFPSRVEMNQDNFPQLAFSRVKSYTSDCSKQLV